MESKMFKTIDNKELIIKGKSKEITLEYEIVSDKFTFEFIFDEETLKRLLAHIKNLGINIFKELKPKEADSLASDYCEYYDRKYDNEACLSLYGNKLRIERPSLENNILYRFNKRRLESFIYDNLKL